MSIVISVIIPTNRPELYLAECLDSLAKQTIEHHLFEIIVVVNGYMFDEHIESCEQWLSNEKHDHIKFFHEEKSGVSRSRNIGLNYASGGYIAFIDDDDVVSPNYLEDLYECVNPSLIAVANVRCFDKDVNDYYFDYLGMNFTYLRHKDYNLLTHRSFLSICCAKLIPMIVIGNNRFNESIDRGEDGLFMASISHKITALKLTNEDCIYSRRVVSNSLSRAKKDTRYIYQQRLKLIFNYLILWLKYPTQINFLFICSRILAVSLHLVKKT